MWTIPQWDRSKVPTPLKFDGTLALESIPNNSAITQSIHMHQAKSITSHRTILFWLSSNSKLFQTIYTVHQLYHTITNPIVLAHPHVLLFLRFLHDDIAFVEDHNNDDRVRVRKEKTNYTVEPRSGISVRRKPRLSRTSLIFFFKFILAIFYINLWCKMDTLLHARHIPHVGSRRRTFRACACPFPMRSTPQAIAGQPAVRCTPTETCFIIRQPNQQHHHNNI